jgi:hypothetical protein
MKLERTWDIVFYCEQPSHWQNIALIVESLLRLCPSLNLALVLGYSEQRYRPLYPEGLRIFYVSDRAFTRLVDTVVFYTPYVGLKKTERPPNSVVVHGLVSMTSLDGVYMRDTFDAYDYIVIGGQHHAESFKEWTKSRSSLSGKCLITGGYPKLDLLVRNINNSPELTDKPLLRDGAPTIVYAPTHIYAVNHSLCSLRFSGESIIETLLGLGYEVIFRPHPVSLHDVDRELVLRLSQRFSQNARFALDTEPDYSRSYDRADILLTDLSGTGFTFSFSYLKPSLFFAPDISAEFGLTGIQFSDRKTIGGIVRSVTEIKNSLMYLLNNTNSIRTQITNYRDRTIFNVGESGIRVAEALVLILYGGGRSEWVNL